MADSIAAKSPVPFSAAAPRPLCPPPRQRPEPSSCCLTTDTPIDRPDLAIYSQAEQFASGLQPSWNSPDISTNWVGANKLMPEAQVLVRNKSAKASAIGANVRCFVSRFGIGFERTLIGTSGVNLAPLQQKQLLVPFPQAVLNGEQRIGFHVRIEHPSDPVQINNQGSQIIDAFSTSAQGRSIATSFLIRNPSTGAQTITVQKLATPAGIQASFSISNAAFGPFEERLCQVQIDVESWLVGGGGVTHDREVTFVARGADGHVIDGITFYVGVNS